MIVELWKAGTMATSQAPHFTVPPVFMGSNFWCPERPMNSQISGCDTTMAPNRWASRVASPIWSPWPWVTRMILQLGQAVLVAGGIFRVARAKRVDQQVGAVDSRWKAECPSHVSFIRCSPHAAARGTRVPDRARHASIPDRNLPGWSLKAMA